LILKDERAEILDLLDLGVCDEGQVGSGSHPLWQSIEVEVQHCQLGQRLLVVLKKRDEFLQKNRFG
jgi:hypothetical protein